MIEERETKVYVYTCPKCGKTIMSMWKRQLEELVRNHEAKHL